MVASAEWLVGAAQFLAVTGLAFGTLLLLASYLRYERLVALAADPAFAAAHGDTAWAACMARRLGALQRRPFSVLCLAPASAEPEGGVAAFVRSRVRRGDDVARLADGTVGVVLDAPVGAAVAAARRLADAAPGLRVGVAGFPDQGDRASELAAVARAAAARATGPVHVAREDGGGAAPWPRATPEEPLAAIPPDQRGWLDPRTGFLSAARHVEMVRRRVAQGRRRGRPLCLACCEWADVRRYRELRGADVADTLLRHLGSYIQGAVREVDLLAQVDDDRFLVVLDCGLDRGAAVMARVQQGGEGIRIPIEGGVITCTLAIGLAGYPEHGGSAADLLRRSRTALDVARAGGGARRAVFNPALEPRTAAGTDVNAW